MEEHVELITEVGQGPQNPEVDYVERAGQPDSFSLESLPQTVALSGAFLATRNHIRKVRGVELSDDDLRGTGGDANARLARTLLYSIVGNFRHTDDLALARELGHKTMAPLLRGIDLSREREDDEMLQAHIRAVQARFRSLMALYVAAGRSPAEPPARRQPEPTPKVEQPEALIVAAPAKPDLAPVVRALIERHKDGQLRAYEALYEHFSERFFDRVLDELEADQGDLPIWADDELDEIFHELLTGVDFTRIADIDDAIYGGLKSGLADALRYGRPKAE